VQSNPWFGHVHQPVNILGNNLTGAATVTFNGVAAKFKVISPSYIQAEVPVGATTGSIQVTTPTATLSSNGAFQVLPLSSNTGPWVESSRGARFRQQRQFSPRP